MGFTIGELLSFVMIAMELHKDHEAQDKIFLIMAATVFFLGIFVVYFMIKDR